MSTLNTFEEEVEELVSLRMVELIARLLSKLLCKHHQLDNTLAELELHTEVLMMMVASEDDESLIAIYNDEIDRNVSLMSGVNHLKNEIRCVCNVV